MSEGRNVVHLTAADAETLQQCMVSFRGLGAVRFCVLDIDHEGRHVITLDDGAPIYFETDSTFTVGDAV